jgi:hypothetical protein
MPRQGVEVTVYIASDGAWPRLTVLKRGAELIGGTVTMTRGDIRQ